MDRITINWLIFFIIISFCLGFLISNLAHKKPQLVEYISQEELLAFEKNRIDLVDLKEEKQIFFGRPKDASSLIEEFTYDHDAKGKIIVLSSGPVFGKNVKSASKEAYEHIMRTLAKSS